MLMLATNRITNSQTPAAAIYRATIAIDATCSTIRTTRSYNISTHTHTHTHSYTHPTLRFPLSRLLNYARSTRTGNMLSSFWVIQYTIVPRWELMPISAIQS